MVTGSKISTNKDWERENQGTYMWEREKERERERERERVGVSKWLCC
jgi:hypothetical protein